MAEEVKYIPYGTGEIDYNQFLENSANQVQSYVNSQPWSQKRKRSFLNAYQDLMTRGVTGASNTTGVWTVNHNGEQIDLNSLSKIDREMYGEAAYFIQQQMSGLPTKQAQQQKTQEEKSKLPLFDNNYFTSQFHTHISNNMFGGRDWTTQEDWNVLDERGDNGLRGTTNRANKLADMLQSYSDSLEEGKYNFENTPFKDLNDLKSRIGNTISALRDNNPDNDTEALNQIGLKYNDYLYNGSNDSFKKDGYEGNYGDYYGRYLPEQQELKAKQEREAQAAKVAKAKANQYKRFRFLKGTGKSLQDLSKYPDIMGQLNGYAQLQTPLSNDQKQEIIGAFRGAAANGQLQNLSREELQRFGSGYANQPNRLKKLPGLEGFYWDTIGDRVIQPFVESADTTGNGFQTLVNNSSEGAQRQQAAQRKLDNGWEAEDYLRMGAMAQDIAGGIAAWTGPYGMAASGVLGLTSLGTNLAADVADESLSGWDVAKNAGVNLGLAAVGMVPGLGMASRTGKWLANIARWAPRLLTIQALKDSPEIYASIKKAIDTPSEVTNQDWKNIAYGLSIAAGLSRGAKGIVNNRKYKPTISQETKTETYITTKSGKKIAATKEQVEAINKAGRKGGNEKANEELRKLKGAENEEVGITFKTGIKGKADPSNRIKLETSTTSIGQSPQVQRYSRALAIQNVRDRNNHPILSRFLPTNYELYRGAANFKLPNVNVIDQAKKVWNPVSQREFKSGNRPQTKIEVNNQKMVENALNPPQRKLRRETKVIKEGETQEATLQDGQKYTFGFKNNTVTIQGNGQNITKPVSTYEEAKLLIANFIKEQNSKVTAQQVNGMRKLSPEFIKSIRDLKRKGFLYKEGGTLDKTISDFLNNNI